MERKPLPNNYRLNIENVGEYVIKRLIGKGGFSLVYEAEIPGGTTQFVIKEYYPPKNAERNDQLKVCPLAEREDDFQRGLALFNQEGVIGGQISNVSFQTVSFLTCGNGYALMKKESNDMISIVDLVAQWFDRPPIPYTGNRNDADPVFTDLVRLKYSLRVIESVLTALSAIHSRGCLHLDLNYRNVLWAGNDQETGRNCAAFIADYGSSVSLSDGVYRPEYQSPTFDGFAAPEQEKGLNVLTPATDIYSVGILLFFLCVGDSALEISCNRKRQVLRETSYLKIPQRLKEHLQKIICNAISDKDSRYQSAYEMQVEIRKLVEMIPLHPINPDNTRSFTLYSLKSMLEGSLETHYSWAHELCDRRGVAFSETNQLIFEPLTWRSFSDDVDFLNWVLPEELFYCLKTKHQSSADSCNTVVSIMSGNYPNKWKDEFCRVIKRYGAMRLMEISSSILNNDAALFENRKLLFEILGEDGERLQDCYYNAPCIGNNRQSSHFGLALLILYALLGPDGFAKLMPSPSIDVDRLFCST